MKQHTQSESASGKSQCPVGDTCKTNDDSNPQQGTPCNSQASEESGAPSDNSENSQQLAAAQQAKVGGSVVRTPRDRPAQQIKIPPTKRDSRKLFVGGLPSNVTDQEFREFFEEYGTVIDSVVMFDRETRRSRGFGFVTFEDQAVAQRFLNSGDNEDKKALSGRRRSGRVMICGKVCEVKAAEPKEASSTANTSSPRSAVNVGRGTAGARGGYVNKQNHSKHVNSVDHSVVRGKTHANAEAQGNLSQNEKVESASVRDNKHKQGTAVPLRDAARSTSQYEAVPVSWGVSDGTYLNPAETNHQTLYSQPEGPGAPFGMASSVSYHPVADPGMYYPAAMAAYMAAAMYNPYAGYPVAANHTTVRSDHDQDASSAGAPHVFPPVFPPTVIPPESAFAPAADTPIIQADHSGNFSAASGHLPFPAGHMYPPPQAPMGTVAYNPGTVAYNPMMMHAAAATAHYCMAQNHAAVMMVQKSPSPLPATESGHSTETQMKENNTCSSDVTRSPHVKDGGLSVPSDPKADEKM